MDIEIGDDTFTKKPNILLREKGQGLRWLHTYNFNSYNCD
jgi:hypothetical protein